MPSQHYHQMAQISPRYHSSQFERRGPSQLFEFFPLPAFFPVKLQSAAGTRETLQAYL